MKIKKRGFSFRKNQARIFTDETSDAFRTRQKFPEPTQCPECGVVYSDGRWHWGKNTENTNEIICPACKRSEEHDPAGIMDLSGTFFRKHRSEIMNLVQNIERRESNNHPLERIMDIHRSDDRTIIHTTGMHLPRRIGDALKSAFEGDLNLSYEAEDHVQITWHRDL
ncbi:BCAM0308 family protein [Balneola sp. MJW-20]|uniref:BCAM0308 family protein n=1 Tax=Gracilimonas aurantiaca TaxID=3234185 RepID=UPI0034655F61